MSYSPYFQNRKHKVPLDGTPICLHNGCEKKVYSDRGYCRDHGHFCQCGKSISRVAKFCARCAQLAIHARRTDEERAALLANLARGNKPQSKKPSHAEELAYVIECYEQAMAKGFYPSLCKDALNKLRNA